MTWQEALGWSLVHFLWQGALIAAILAGVLGLVPGRNSRFRYAASCAAMVAMLTSAAATVVYLRAEPAPAKEAGPIMESTVRNPDPVFPAVAPPSIVTAGFTAYLPALVWVWFAGVIVLSLRAGGSWAVAERFARRNTWRPDAIWEEKLTRIARQLRISAPIRLAVSGLAEVPAVVGWLRPVVLMPAAVFTGLPPAQIEALLAHELAHIRRHDYLINLAQTVAETLLFYHPAVWWVGRKIRQERENCCDDLAVEITGNVGNYVRALTDLEQMRRGAPRLAMAADGGSLLHRVQRLLGVKPGTASVRSSWMGLAGAALALVLAGVGAHAFAQQEKTADSQAQAPPAAAPRPAEPQDIPDQPDTPPEVQSDLQRLDQEVRQRNAEASRQNAEALRQNAEMERAVRELEELQKKTAENNPEIAQLNGEQANLRAQLSRFTDQQPEAHRLKAEIAALDSQVRRIIDQNLADYTGRIADLKMRSRVLLAQAAQALQAAQAPQASQAPAQPGWLDQIEAEGLRNLSVDELIRLKEAGVTGEYIRQMHAAGLQPNTNDWVRLREHGVTADYVSQMTQAGYPNLPVNQLVRLREHGVSPENARQARGRFKDLTIDQLIRLKEHGIL